jgi:secretory phospholipase A2
MTPLLTLVVFVLGTQVGGTNGALGALTPITKPGLQQGPAQRPESSSSLFADVEDLNDSSIKTRLGRIKIEHLGESPHDFDQLIERITAETPLDELSVARPASSGMQTTTTAAIANNNQQPNELKQLQPSKVSADPNNKTIMRFFRNNRTFASVVYTNPVQNDKRLPRRLINCHLVDLERHSSDVALYEAKYDIRTIDVEFRDMMQLIEACTNIARTPKRPGPAQQQKQTHHHQSVGAGGAPATAANSSGGGVREAIQEISSHDSSDLLAIWRGILPGTNWCGMGDRATSYNDLGFESDIDICCRAHDFCPIRLSAFSFGYGVFNWSFYTRSHCWCDKNFLDCLRRAESPLSSVVMKFYFGIMKTTCLNDNETMNALEQLDSMGIRPVFEPGQAGQQTLSILPPPPPPPASQNYRSPASLLRVLEQQAAAALGMSVRKEQQQQRQRQQQQQPPLQTKFTIPALRRSREFQNRLDGRKQQKQ